LRGVAAPDTELARPLMEVLRGLCVEVEWLKMSPARSCTDELFLAGPLTVNLEEILRMWGSVSFLSWCSR